MKRMVGLETEYGCLCAPDLVGPPVPDRIRDYVFETLKLGLLDVHDRDYDEPAGNGGFLFNGGRLYLDMGHVEYCTAECLHLSDVVAYDSAGEVILQRALDELGLAEHASFIKNNIDHYTGATFGCHENYLLSREAPLHQVNIDSLLAFLAVRGLMTGAGRVGAVTAPRRFEKATPMESVPFQIMQRADYIQTEIYEWVQFNRALINARDEPLADPARFRRLHLLLGDSNVLPFTNALKIGSTALVLDLLEADKMPKLSLADPVRTMRELSHRPDGEWKISLSDGRNLTGLELLEEFHTASRKAKMERDEDSAWTLQAWEFVVKNLQKNRAALVGKIDWVTKRQVLQNFVEAEGLTWDDPWLESLDLEFHQTNPARNLSLTLPDTGLASLKIPHYSAKTDYMFTPPANTRASARSQLMREQIGAAFYVIDWDYIQSSDKKHYQLGDPFQTRPPLSGEFPLSIY